MEAHVRNVRFTPENVNAATLEEVAAQMVHVEHDDFTVADKISTRFQVNDFRFLPLVGSIFGGIDTVCSVDILFLRRDAPGKIVSGGGDIDNRLKTLLDALKMPKPGELRPQEQPEAGDNPFFCLLQDDSLITQISVTTDRLLTPLVDDEHENDVHLVIHVRTELIGHGGDVGAATAFMT